MGYIGNMLPKYLVAAGADVHYITMDLPHYFQVSGDKQSYQGFVGVEVTKPGSIECVDGVTLHGLAHRRVLGQMRFVGLREKLEAIRPDVVQSLTCIGWPALDAALYQHSYGYQLFTAAHTTLSVFPLGKEKMNGRLHYKYIKNWCTRFLPGRMISNVTRLCYAATADCAEIATRFFGVEADKVRLALLGVDTALFHPVNSAAAEHRRQEVRRQLGFADTDIVCIYTGQFSDAKNPLIVARAIAALRDRGMPFRGLFVGGGCQAAALHSTPGCVVMNFLPVNELGDLYRGADIGAWPVQESTSLLDAAACGLPIVVSDRIPPVGQLEGRALTYHVNSMEHLASVFSDLADANRRRSIGHNSAEQLMAHFSWQAISEKRLHDYEGALRQRGLFVMQNNS